MEGEKGAVCVTGGTGYIASWLIMRLLGHVYSGHTTIRPDPGASDKLKIFHADLSDPDSLDAAIEGCVRVCHLATPLFKHFETEEPELVVINKATDGTLGILKVCLKHSKTVKRVVYTNDINAEEMDESFWSDVDFIKGFKTYESPYYISKTLAEKSAFEFAEEHGLDLVTIIPPHVVGPFICHHLPESVKRALAMIFGKPELYNMLINTPIVHVDDLTRAHIFLLEYPNAKGRHNCSSGSITIEGISDFLSARYPELSIPRAESLKDVKGFKLPALSSKKLIDYGFNFEYGIAEIFDEAVQSCKEMGYI